VRRGRPQKWDSGIAYSGMTNSDHRYLIIFKTNYINNTIKYKQRYIFLNEKKLIFNIKLNITLKSLETFINQNTQKNKTEEQIKKIIKQEKP
jgi:hypothetical protein